MSIETLIVNDNNQKTQTEQFEARLNEILHKHKPLMQGILDRISAADVKVEDAETILLWIVGTSVGMRQAQSADDFNMFTLAKAWQYVVSQTAN